MKPLIHALTDFISTDCHPTDRHHYDLTPTYWYEGYCPQTGKLLRLPRTVMAETIAKALMHQLEHSEGYDREGKMYGILLVEAPTGEWGVLKAFSGLLWGQREITGWVPPIPGRELVAYEETITLKQLNEIKQELMALKALPVRQKYEALRYDFEQQLSQLTTHHNQRKQERQQQRLLLSQTLSGTALEVALEALNQQSRQDGIARRRLKQQRDLLLDPLHQQIIEADDRIQQLKQQRKALSRQLQTQLSAAYRLTNFAGDSLSLQQLTHSALPTGTGDCCAPKLLHYAATQGLKPLAMAEFWWGSSFTIGDKMQGQFYGACSERCQPIMGFLLSGLSQPESSQAELAQAERSHPKFSPPDHSFRNVIAPVSLSGSIPEMKILYEDNWFIAVNKPAGLLSVPGRYHDRQDSVLSRLQAVVSNDEILFTVHRLDQDTSGILLIARNLETYRHLSRQFQTRQVHKVYEAVLAGKPLLNEGTIDLPLWADPLDRPYQKVDWQRGKPSLTHYRVLARDSQTTRIEFLPHTGRTHQLRVHAANAQGLGIPILGDRLYGKATPAQRLHLHARELAFQHPGTQELVRLQSQTPF